MYINGKKFLKQGDLVSLRIKYSLFKIKKKTKNSLQYKPGICLAHSIMPTSCFSYKFESICVIFSSSGTDESGMANTVSGSHDIKELSNLLSRKRLKVVYV